MIATASSANCSQCLGIKWFKNWHIKCHYHIKYQRAKAITNNNNDNKGTLNNPWNFQRPFNFGLLLKFELS